MNEQEELERARLHFEDSLAGVVRIRDLEAENARLQVAMDWVEGHLGETRRERDGYKALAERRGEALKPFANVPDGVIDSEAAYLSGLLGITLSQWREARAAIAATPDGTKEG